MPVVPYTAMQRPAKPASASHPAGAVQTRTSKRTLPAQLTRDQNTTGLMAHLQQVSSLSVKEWAEWHKEWHISEKRCRAGQLEVCVWNSTDVRKNKNKERGSDFSKWEIYMYALFFFFFLSCFSSIQSGFRYGRSRQLLQPQPTEWLDMLG